MPLIRISVPEGTATEKKQIIHKRVREVVLKTLAPKQVRYDYVSIIEAFADKVPILGVCLGHQSIGQYFGGNIVRADRLMHGKTSVVKHNGKGIFAGIPNEIRIARYHSLIIEREAFPDILQIVAETDEGEIMACHHRERPIWGLQFHPESIATQNGMDILKNFINL